MIPNDEELAKELVEGAEQVEPQAAGWRESAAAPPEYQDVELAETRQVRWVEIPRISRRGSLARGR
uniref:hypothetical protein n=1 Tax=Nonomuraea pusilla TaxID=46177 RepID=UPI0006E15A0F|nr:hypothetical protein [Nonomuraea pusilla]